MIIHYSCLSQSSWPFAFTKLVSSFRLLKNGADCRFSLSDRFILIFQLNDIILNLHRHLFGFHIETSTEQLPNASSALGINSRSFVCLICLEIMREQAALGQEAACHPITFETFELTMLRSMSLTLSPSVCHVEVFCIFYNCS